MPRPEFQAVIMAAGKGSRMPEIAASRPKCLLPIGNKPLIWFPLQLLEKARFTDVIMVIQEIHKAELLKAIDKIDVRLKIDYVVIPASEDWGTADSLRHIGDKVTSDILVLSCDLITDFKLNGIFEVFRNHDASIVSLLYDNENLETVPMPGPKSKHKPERDLIGIDGTTNRLVFLASASDFDDTVHLTKRLLRKHPNMTVYSRLLDSHCYVMKHWVLDYICHEKSFTTIKGELIPHIVKKQLSKKPNTPELDKNHSIVNAEIRNDIFRFAQEDELNVKVRKTSSFNDHFGDMKPAYHGDVIRCYAYKAEGSHFGVRINTLQAYCLANAEILNRWNDITAGVALVKHHPNAEIRSKQIDEQCLIGEGTRISEKTSIKGCFIGNNSFVDNKVRLTSCIIMNNVKIAEGCVLTSCIICDGATIENGVELKFCLIGNNHTVSENSTHTNEVLTAADRLMEI